jgi:hypothetical protein
MLGMEMSLWQFYPGKEQSKNQLTIHPLTHPSPMLVIKLISYMVTNPKMQGKTYSIMSKESLYT